MVAPINHKKAAENLLKACEQTGSTNQQEAMGSVAQAYATLALVEQQQVNNIIALISLGQAGLDLRTKDSKLAVENLIEANAAKIARAISR